MENISALMSGNPVDFTELKADREIKGLEREITDKSGKHHLLLLDIKRISPTSGEVLYRCRDITRPKQTQEELRRHRHHLEDLVEERTTELSISNRQLERQNRLLSALSRIQTQFISDVEPHLLFDQLLDELLSLTESEYGFIGQVFHNPDGEPYLKTYAISNITWSSTGGLYGSGDATGIEFQNLKSLIGAVMSSGKQVIAHSPGTESQGKGAAKGHPRSNAFLGLPLQNGKGLIGMVGIGNRPAGYDTALVEFLQPFLVTCGNIITAYRNVQQRRQAEAELSKSEQNFRNLTCQII